MKADTENTFDIIVVGGGMVGLAMALSAANLKLSVAVIEPKPLSFDWQPEQLDARVSAVNLGNRDFLKTLGIWDELRSKAVGPLRAMQVWDAVGGGQIEFNAADIAKPELGFIIENREIVQALWARLENHDHVTLFAPAAAKALQQNNALVLASGKVLHAQLIIGADGGRSWLRDQANITHKENPYQQKAIVAVIESDRAHQRTAYQAFLDTGPVALLPLSHMHQNALVWSASESRADALLALDESEFCNELQNAMNYTLEGLRCLTPPKAIPLVMRHADQYILSSQTSDGSDVGIALIGDAAHTIHPLAGQGVNLGFQDAAALAGCLARALKRQQPIAGHKTLRRFERARRAENQTMIWTMAAFHHAFTKTQPQLAQLRSLGLNIVDRLSAVKQLFMDVVA